MCSLPRTSEWQGAGQAPSCALQETISLGDQQACGMNEQQAMANANKVNAAFSQYAWAAAQQEGCLACPQRLPTWPPEFQYPQDSKVPDEVVGVDPNFGITDTPFYQPPIAVTQPVTVPPPPGAATGYNTALAGVQPTAPSSQPSPQGPCVRSQELEAPSAARWSNQARLLHDAGRPHAFYRPHGDLFGGHTGHHHCCYSSGIERASPRALGRARGRLGVALARAAPPLLDRPRPR